MKASSGDDDGECVDGDVDPECVAATAVFEGYSQYDSAAIIRYGFGFIEKAEKYSQDLTDGFAVAHFSENQ